MHIICRHLWHLRQLVVCDALVGLPGAGVGLTQPSRDAFAAVAAVGSARNAAPQELPPGLALYQHQGVAEDHVEHLRTRRRDVEAFGGRKEPQVRVHGGAALLQRGWLGQHRADEYDTLLLALIVVHSSYAHRPKATRAQKLANLLNLTSIRGHDADVLGSELKGLLAEERLQHVDQRKSFVWVEVRRCTLLLHLFAAHTAKHRAHAVS
mmetsp:Transcript_9098/g.17037  ORF Transcript_9098/g.17037 Transcript_9098/m.17037 type:complete len:209 (-) Transcript_9098:1226-1852(-)